MSFKPNNDLNKIVFSFHNKFHFWGGIAIALVVGWLTRSAQAGFCASYGVLMVWEVLDGFKPWYTDFKYDEFQPYWLNWLRENTLYADGFSFQDAFVHNLMGALIGTGIVTLII